MPDEWTKKRATIRHYNETATTYNILYKEEQEQKIREILKHVSINDSDVILDAGCGSGFLNEHVQKQASHIVGVDLSKGLLRIAVSRIRQAGMKNVSLVQADVDYLPFKEQIFDEAFALTVLQDSSFYSVMLKELMRTTKNNAKVIITGLKKTFSEQSFKRALKEQRLNPRILETSEKLRDIIAVCRKGA